MQNKIKQIFQQFLRANDTQWPVLYLMIVVPQEDDDIDEGETVAHPSKSPETLGRNRRQHERKKRR